MEKMKGVMPKKNTPELVSGNKDVVAEARATKRGGGPTVAWQRKPDKATEEMGKKYGNMMGQPRKSGGKAKKDMGKMAGKMAAMRADRKARKSGGICSSDWTAAQGEGSKPRG
jgi:hypothetical protein